ncbi:RNA-binding protein [Mesorhizobium sp. GbtcB19]|uniref:RNA-binding protein n=1 Tax=Mesorhizobium sp. GbtcB19 TaxID=2824764 RepID=UPI001C2F5781|nr:RNA-binding protein [Mesorhizobium sp. GbtcB19]
MSLSRYSGLFDPADLDLLQRVFDQLCNERRLAQKDREQREALAEEIVGVFQNGVTDETELWRALSKRRKA